MYFAAAADFALYRRYANVIELITGGFSLCAGDEEWDDGNEQNVLEAAEQDNETTAIKRECYLLDCQLSHGLFFSIYVQQVATFIQVNHTG